MTRTAFLALAALVLLAALPGAAAPVPVAAAATPSCGQAALPFDLAGLAPAPTPAAAVQALPDWLAGARPAQTAVIYHGYCACECSRIKDCNTNADCSNHRCLGGISCC